MKDKMITHGHWARDPLFTWCGIDISDWEEVPYNGEQVDCVDCLKTLSPEMSSCLVKIGSIRELVLV